MRNSMTRWIIAAVLLVLAAPGALAHVINLLTIQTFGEEKQVRKSMLRSLVSLMFLLMLSAAHATAAITLTSYTDYTSNQWTLGSELAPTTNIDVTSLGNFFPTGATDEHGVTIWNTSGTALATTTVTGTGTEGFDYTAITPLALMSGTDYVIGASTLTDDYADINAAWTVGPGINYIEHLETLCTSVTPCFPTVGTASFGDFGANFQYTTATVPAPAIGCDLPSILAIGCLFLGAKLLEGHNRRRSLGTVMPQQAP